MKIVNTKTKKDVTKFYLAYLYDEITKEEFENLAELEAKDLNITIND